MFLLVNYSYLYQINYAWPSDSLNSISEIFLAWSEVSFILEVVFLSSELTLGIKSS